MRRMMIGWLAVCVVLLVGCGGMSAEASQATLAPVTSEDTGLVIAEGTVEAAEWRGVSFRQPGTLTTLHIKEGDGVEAGQILAELDSADAELALQAAEATLVSAEAQLAQLQAGARDEDLAVAEAQYQQALAQYRGLRNQPSQEEIEMARATLGQTEAQLKQAQAAYDPVAWRPEISMLPQSLALEQATLAYQQAQAQYDLAVKGADDETLTAAWQRVEQAEAQLARLKNGPTPEEIAVAEAAVWQAESGVAQADLALAHTTLTAPLAGTVTQITAEEGDAITPGQAIARLATVEQLQVRTIDLTELDAVRVDVGQPVTVIIDALPDVTLRGHVVEIALEAVDYRGDVTYPVTIALEEMAPALRLGMTAVVRIAVD